MDYISVSRFWYWTICIMLLGEIGQRVHRSLLHYFFFFFGNFLWIYNYLEIRKWSTKKPPYLCVCVFLYIEKEMSLNKYSLQNNTHVVHIVHLPYFYSVTFTCFWAQHKYPNIRQRQDAVSIFILYAFFSLNANSHSPVIGACWPFTLQPFFI